MVPIVDTDLTLVIVGPIQLIDRDGCERTPKGRKARGILALLAVAPGNCRSRAWIQDKLWSDRGSEQGAGSLRQTLTELRRSLGPFKTCLLIDRTMVTLDPRRVAIVLQESATAGRRHFSFDDPVLFEGLDVPDREFEDWLRDQRQIFDLNREPSSDPRSVACDMPQAGGAEQPRASAMSTRRVLVLQPKELKSTPQGSIGADRLTDIIAKTISEFSTIDVLDFRDLKANSPLKTLSEDSLSLRTDVAEDTAGATWRVVLSTAIGRKLVASVSVRQCGDCAAADDPGTLREANYVIEAALDSFLSAPYADDQQRMATILCHQGIKLLFQLGRENLQLADDLFQRAFELEQRGVYLGWRAYLRTFLLAERLAHDRVVVAEEALDLNRRALELEPYNSYVASFSAQVHTIVRRSYVAAYEYAQRSIQLNRANPLGWACLGIAECHLGKALIGFEHALVAREIARATPIRFQIDGLACIAGSMAGDVGKSIWLGEASHAFAPTFKPPLRYLSALYLLSDKQEESFATVQKLKILEPEFSYDLLRDKAYPTIGLQRSKLLDRLPTRQI
jgi:tetratricopeptide (TPR) repeat protein